MSMTIDAPLAQQTQIQVVPDYATPGRGGTSPDAGYLMPDLCEEKKSYRRLWLGVAIVIFAMYAFTVFRFWAPADEGVDQNAYLVGGRLLAEHFSMKYTLPNPYAYTGGMFVRMTPALKDGVTNPDGVYFPKYPFGLPFLYACFIWVFKAASVLPFLGRHINPAQGVYWAFLVSPISAIVGIVGMYFLARQIAGSFAAVLATLLLASSQLMMMLMNNPNSHESCMAFIIWGIYLCIRWLQTGSHWRGIVGGILVGYAATIRYNEGLLFAVMCVVVLSRWPWNTWKSWRSISLVAAVGIAAYMIYLQVQNVHGVRDGTAERWTPFYGQTFVTIYMVLILYSITMATLSALKLQQSDWMMYLKSIYPGLGWAVPVSILMFVNYHTMGSFAGYDSTHESEFGVGFQWKFFWQNWEKVTRSFYDMGLFFVVPFAVAGMAMLFRRSWRIGLMMLMWLVPGVMLYMSYYWSMDFADSYARFFLTYLPVLLVGAAFCFHEGLLGGGKESRRYTGIPLTISVGIVVAIASGVSMFRTVHGMRDGEPMAKVPLNDFHQRLSLANTGQVLLDKVPANSILFADASGGIATPANYIQFLRDWELYPVNAFSPQGGMGFGGGGGGRQRPNRNNNNNRGGGRGNFGGGGFNGGPPGGGNFGGPPGGGPPGNNNTQDDTATAVATPTQPEQREYHGSLYAGKGVTSSKLHDMEADLIHNAITGGRRVFVVVSSDHALRTSANNGGFNMFNNNVVTENPIESFEDDLGESNKYKFKYTVVSRWQDAAVPEDKEEDTTFSSNNPMGGGAGGPGGRGQNNMLARMIMGANSQMDWQLVEITTK
jgi:Dolichyl-phosphate-mannose-protein mannosyltransferase